MDGYPKEGVVHGYLMGVMGGRRVPLRTWNYHYYGEQSVIGEISQTGQHVSVRTVYLVQEGYDLKRENRWLERLV
jgi:hypothetical protein